MDIHLDPPKEALAAREFAKVNQWVRAWQAWKGRGTIEWQTRKFRTLGTQEVPTSIQFATPEDVAVCLHEGPRWRNASSRHGRLRERWPVLASRLARHYPVLADYEDADFQRLEDTLAWLEAHPQSDLYLRQLPIAGVDSKWIESRKGLMRDLVSLLLGVDPSGKEFLDLCGLKRKPTLIRLLILDEALRSRVGGIRDLSLPLAELARLSLPVERAYVVENEHTGIAFEDLSGAVVIMGGGYAVGVLADVPWLQKVECFYWGDIDTHGLRILNNLRAGLPHVKSLLMDEATLIAHRELWGQEDKPDKDPGVPALLNEEQSLYIRLQTDLPGVRLEQERIPWNYAWPRVKNPGLGR